MNNAATRDDPKAQEVSFYEVGLTTGTEKVTAPGRLPGCLKNDASCIRPSCEREECRPWGHYYHTMYQQKFGNMTVPGTEPFQFLEIGFVSCPLNFAEFCSLFSYLSVSIRSTMVAAMTPTASSLGM